MNAKISNPIIIVESFKGGVGKSMVATTLLEYLRAQNLPVSLVETGGSQSDIWKIYENKINSFHIDLKEEGGAGWLKLVDVAESNPETLIVNMHADSKYSTESNRDVIANRLLSLFRPVIVFFVLGIQNVSVVGLKEALDVYKGTDFVVVKNQKNGEVSGFLKYGEAKERGELPSILEIDFPRIHALTSLKITDNGLPISEMLEEDSLKAGERAALQGWINTIFKSYELLGLCQKSSYSPTCSI